MPWTQRQGSQPLIDFTPHDGLQGLEAALSMEERKKKVQSLPC